MDRAIVTMQTGLIGHRARERAILLARVTGLAPPLKERMRSGQIAGVMNRREGDRIQPRFSAGAGTDRADPNPSHRRQRAERDQNPARLAHGAVAAEVKDIDPPGDLFLSSGARHKYL